MTFLEFSQKAKEFPIFKTTDTLKWFPKEKKETILHQLTLWTKKGYIERLRRGGYQLADYKIQDSRILCNLLYAPSYISLETALNSYGLIPDIPFATTAVTIQKTKIFRTKDYGTFFYHHVSPKLFFGFHTVPGELQYAYSIASQEKALFDYFYLKVKQVSNPEEFLAEMRLSLPADFSFSDILAWQKLVPSSAKNFHHLLRTLLKLYGQ